MTISGFRNAGKQKTQRAGAMNEYRVTITETLQKTISVKAGSLQEAEGIVESRWQEANIYWTQTVLRRIPLKGYRKDACPLIA